jgi:hypothetical protein
MKMVKIRVQIRDVCQHARWRKVEGECRSSGYKRHTGRVGMTRQAGTRAASESLTDVAKDVTEPRIRRPSLAAACWSGCLWRPSCRSYVGDGLHFEKMPQKLNVPHHFFTIHASPIIPHIHQYQLPTISPTAAQSLSSSNLPASLVAGTPSVGGFPRFPDRPLTCAPTPGARFQACACFCPYRHFHKQKLAPLHPSTAHRTPHRPPKPIGLLDNIDSYHCSPSPHCARQHDKVTRTVARLQTHGTRAI